VCDRRSGRSSPPNTIYTVRWYLRTCLWPDSVMKFGFYCTSGSRRHVLSSCTTGSRHAVTGIICPVPSSRRVDTSFIVDGSPSSMLQNSAPTPQNILEIKNRGLRLENMAFIRQMLVLQWMMSPLLSREWKKSFLYSLTIHIQNGQTTIFRVGSNRKRNTKKFEFYVRRMAFPICGPTTLQLCCSLLPLLLILMCLLNK